MRVIPKDIKYREPFKPEKFEDRKEEKKIISNWYKTIQSETHIRSLHLKEYVGLPGSGKSWLLRFAEEMARSMALVTLFVGMHAKRYQNKHGPLEFARDVINSLNIPDKYRSDIQPYKQKFDEYWQVFNSTEKPTQDLEENIQTAFVELLKAATDHFPLVLLLDDATDASKYLIGWLVQVFDDLYEQSRLLVLISSKASIAERAILIPKN